MEVIRIPQVSLVDATGKRIGVYTDDPDWWQQLKLKHKNAQLRQIKEKEEADAISENGSAQQMGSKVLLVKDSDKEDKKSAGNDLRMDELDASKGHSKGSEENHNQCNIIGETQLHIAIMYNDFETIKFLVEEKGFDVNQRSASGKFIGGFNSKTTASLIQQSKYEGLAYYGEYPLAFAACFATKEIYDYLIDHDADPNMQDTYGNTVLHVLVINNKLDMFQYATNHPKKKALMTIKNSQDLTPVNLAAKLGRKDLFAKMLELRNMEIWRYSNITCSTYPLEGLDTVDAQGKIAWNAALSYIVNGDTEEHLDMLEIGVVKRLLEDKWSTYVQKRLFQRLILSTIHLICLSIAVYTRAGDYKNLAVWPPTNGSTWVRYFTELAVVIGCIIQLFLSAQEIYGQGFIYFLKNLKGEPANVFYQIFCILILAAVPFRFVTFDSSSTVTPRSVEDTLVILAIPCGWVHLLFYARVVTVTGPFVVMIYKMIVGDILTFASIYGFLLFGFSLGFYYLYKNVASTVSTMNSYPEALMISFQMTLGEFKARLPEFDLNYYADFTKVVFVAFMILMHILLLNMLIAMMGNTYHQIIKKSEKEWRKQWAHIVILLERSFSQQDLKKFQDQYCIKLPSKDPNKKDDIVALMVIKKAPKTKAFQKTACIKNWKRFSKNVLAMLKEHKCTGVKLLEIWENKDKKVIKHKKEKKDFNWVDFSTRKSLTPAVHVQVKDTKNEKQPPKTDLFGIKKNSDSKSQDTKPTTSSHVSSTSSTVSSSSSTSNSRIDSASATSQFQSSSSNNLSANTTAAAPNTNTLVVTRNTQKKTFFPNTTSKIYPVVTTSASSVNPEVPDDDDKVRNIDLGEAAKTNSGNARRPTYPRFPLLIQNELSDSDLKNNDSSSETSSVMLDENEDAKKKQN